MDIRIVNPALKSQLPNGIPQQPLSGLSSPPTIPSATSLKGSSQRLLPNRQQQPLTKLSSPNNNSMQEVILAKLHCPPEFDPVFYAVLLQCELNGIKDLILAGFNPNVRQRVTPNLLLEIERLIVNSGKLNARTRLHLLGLVKAPLSPTKHSDGVSEAVDAKESSQNHSSLANGAALSGKRTAGVAQPHTPTSSKNAKLASKAAFPPVSSASPMALAPPLQSTPSLAATSRPMLELSALALACAFSNSQLVRLLIELGADFKLVCNALPVLFNSNAY